jgi:hypothetical protein
MGTISSDTLQGDTITDKAGTGAPDFPQGLSVGGASSLSQVRSGVYTPTFSNETNINTSVSSFQTYIQVGNVVMVFGKTTGNVTSAGADVTFDVTLPINPDNPFSGGSQATGDGTAASGTTTDDILLFSVSGANTVRIVLESGSGVTGTHTFYYEFSYITNI